MGLLSILAVFGMILFGFCFTYDKKEITSTGSSISLINYVMPISFIGFINNFGQIPKQLFKKAHPAKRVTTLVQVKNKP